MSEHTAKTRIRVLVIDDDEHDVRALERTLKQASCCSFQPMFFGRAEDAIAALEHPAIHYDVGLVDYSLPGLSGLEAGEMLLEAHPELPLIMLTGEGSEELAVQALHAGFQDYVVKDTRAGYLTLLPTKLQDVMLRSRRESEALRMQERYARLVEHSPDVFYSFSIPKGRIFISNRVDKVLGYSQHYLLANPKLWCESIHEQDQPALKKALEGMSKGDHYTLDYRIRRADGEWIWLRDRSIGIEGEGEEAVVSGVAMEITEEKELEFMKESFEMVTRHDLRSPLSGIVGLSRLLAEDLEGEPRDLAFSINSAAVNMMQILNRWMDLYKLEAGIFDPARDKLNLDEAMQNATTDLLRQPWFSKHSIVAPPAPADVVGDGVLLFNVLTNLLKNALEVSPAEEPVHVSYDLDGDMLTIHIHNNQLVNPEIEKHFFNKFHSKGKKFGTGLGTYSAKLMTETMGGTIRLECDPMRGTTIHVSLPVAR